MPPLQHCTAVVLNWNGWPDTLACVQSLLAAQPAPRCIVVCDNGSADRSLVQLTAAFREAVGAGLKCIQRDEVESADPSEARIWLVANQANLGFAAGNNVGLRLALRDPACTHAWILNNDTEVAGDALARALARMDARPDIGVCGSTLVYAHDRQTVQALGGSAYSCLTGRTRHLGAHRRLADVPSDPAGIEAEMACVVGAAMLVHRDWLETVGLLGESYFLYFEEMDWATRAARMSAAGPRRHVGWAPGSVVYHKEGAAIGTAATGGSPVSLHFLFRNRLRFAWAFHKACTPSVLAFMLWDIAKLALRRRWPQARAALCGTLQRAWADPSVRP